MQEPEPINWVAWRKDIDPALVDAFKAAYDSALGPPAWQQALGGGAGLQGEDSLRA